MCRDKRERSESEESVVEPGFGFLTRMDCVKERKSGTGVMKLSVGLSEVHRNTGSCRAVRKAVQPGCKRDTKIR